MDFYISTDRSLLDVAMIHRYLSEDSYWCAGIPLETVQRSIEHSLCFGVYHKDGRQAGFARVVSDFATVAYLGDVFVLPEFRGQGLSKRLMEAIHTHPDLQGLRRWILLTRDAHELYRQFEWKEIAAPDRWMERHNPEVYKTAQPRT